MSMARYQVTEPKDSDPEPGALISRAAGLGLNTAGGTTNHIIYANKLEIHNRVEIHNHYCNTARVGSTSAARVGSTSAAGVGSTPTGASSFEGNQPSFQLISTVRGIDFGNKLAKRYYKAEKHIDKKLNLVAYTQTRSNVERAAHAVTFGLSSKRSTHVVILFDTDLLRQFADAWPSRIPLEDVETLLHNLGANNLECTRTKVKKDRFSLYLFGIKQRGEHFSQQSFQIWKDVFYWAHHLDPSTDNAIASTFVMSPALILEFALRAASTVLLGS